MTTEKPLTNTTSAGLPAPRRLVGDTGALGAAIGKAESFRAASKSAATVRAYASVWRAFTAWCEKRGVPSLPASPATVAAYLADRAEPESGRALRPSSLQVHAAAIAKAHKLAGMQSPLDNEHVRDALDGIRRRFGIAPKQKAAVCTEDVRRLVAVCGDDRKGLRDRALILVGYAGAMRRSELVALDVTDLRETNEGLEIVIRRSKTDQVGEGRTIGICYGSDPKSCPVRAMRAWLETSGIEEGSVFRPLRKGGALRLDALSPHAVAKIIKALATRAGLDPSNLSGHSLRAGHATEAARNGALGHEIRKQTGHKSDAMLARYIRAGTVFERNSSARLRL